jgi:DNA-binding MarR family transcriptional regulator
MSRDQEYIDRIRSFNRFYTNVIGLLDRHYLETPYSLIESRVLYEVRHTRLCTAKKIRSRIDIDEGYLSRIIDKFIQQGLVKKRPALEDRRLHIIALTEKGRREFSKLNENSDKSIAHMIRKLSGSDRAELAAMMDRIQELLMDGQGGTALGADPT